MRAAWRISVLQLEDAVDLLNDTVGRGAALELGDEAAADVFDTPDLQTVLKNGVASDSLTLLLIIDAANTWLDLRCLTRKVANDSIKSGLIILVKQDELVRDHTHLLKCNSLSLSARETFNNPAFLAGLHLLNLLAHEFDNDFVANVTVSRERLLDILTILLILLCDLIAKQVTHSDTLKVLALVNEICLQSKGNSLMLATRRSNKHNARS